MRRSLPLVISTFISFHGQAMEYLVRPGDTLSSIAYTQLQGRVYGKRGNLVRLWQLNQNLLSSQSKIYPGQVILLGEVSSEPIPGPVSTAEPQVALPPPVALVEEQSRLELGLGFNSELISATDVDSGAHAEAATTNSSNADFRWFQLWDQNFETYLGLSIFRRSFEVSTEGDIKDPTKTTTNFEIGARHRFSDISFAGLVLGYNKELILQSTSGTELELVGASIPKAGLAGRLGILNRKRLDLFADLEGGSLLPGSGAGVDTKSGYYFSTGLGVRYRKGTVSYLGNVFYRESQFDTSETEQKSKSVGLGLALAWDF